MKYILLLVFSIAVLHQNMAQDYVPGVLVVKLKDKDQLAKAESLNLLKIDDLKRDEKIIKLKEFKNESKRAKKSTAQSRLDNLYKIDIEKEISEKSYMSFLQSFDNVEYVEQYPNVRPLYVPNDPEAQFGQEQFHLSQINVYDAWNITQGGQDIVIGVIDTGVDLDHEDLEANLYLNTADQIDGIDNDNDGYIDNYYGWDFADNDNAPEADGSTHGTGVTGIAAAATDNNTGIAGIGFNTKFMPIKIFKTEDNFSRNSYEAIIYAADQGCDIINLSWGSAGRYSQFAQDIINYAVLEKDVVVVAAAGNTNAELDFFPASYDNVLSVGYVNDDDSRNLNATFSDFIDLVAPGVGIYTTENDNNYNNDSGSSYAAPMVAGAAALIRAIFPEWTAQQVMEQLRVSTDDINEIGNNSDFQYKFGKGRLNVFRSLADFDQPSIRISDLNYTNGLEEAAYFGDTLEIILEFTNYLEATENVNLTLTSSSPYVTILQEGFSIQSLNTFDKINNEDQKFQVVLSEDLPENEALNFRILFEGQFYQDYQSFQIQSSSKIRLFEFNNWSFGFTATGNLGRSLETPFDNYAVRYGDNKLIDHLGLVLSVGGDSIRRNTSLNPNLFQYLEDFQSALALKRYDDITADLDVRSILKEKDEIENALGIYVGQRFLGWNDQQDLFVHQFRLENRSENDYDSLYFALFADFAVGDKFNNSLEYDSALQLAYAYDDLENEFVGLSLLTAQDSIFYAFDLAAENGHSSDLENDSLKDNVIKNALENPFLKQKAGSLEGGNNVGSLLGILIPSFNSNAQQTVAFTVIRADNLDDLKSKVSTAKDKDSLSYTLPPFGKQIFICKDENAVLEAPTNSTYQIYASPTIDTTLYTGTEFEFGPISNDTTIYVSEIDSLGISGIRKRFVISIKKPQASFLLPAQPILIEQEGDNVLKFTDQSQDAENWHWTFSNGFSTSKQNPNIIFDEEGEYTAELIVTNSIGCQDTIMQSFEVFQRAAKPQLGDFEICRNSELIINDPTIQELTIYSDSLLENQIFKGAELVIEDLVNDTTLYIRNEIGQYPSKSVKVEVSVVPLSAEIEVNLDMTSDSKEMRGLAVSRSEFAEELVWIFNGDTIGSSNEVYFDLEGLKEGPLILHAKSALGCTDTTFFQSSASEDPEFDFYELCQSEGVLLSAKNTERLYFFKDESLTEFIGKGAEVNIESVAENMRVYAVNVENVHPSEAVEVPILISDLSAEFTVSRDTINLAFEDEIQFEATSDLAINWEWKIENQNFSSNRISNYQFTKAGVFEVQLTVSDTIGCESISKTQIVVFNDPLLGNKDELRSYFSIFPNPADNFVHLTAKDQFEFDSYSIIDSKGREVKKSKNDLSSLQTEIINVSELKQGPYYLIIRKGKLEASFLFVISR